MSYQPLPTETQLYSLDLESQTTISNNASSSASAKPAQPRPTRGGGSKSRRPLSKIFLAPQLSSLHIVDPFAPPAYMEEEEEELYTSESDEGDEREVEGGPKDTFSFVGIIAHRSLTKHFIHHFNPTPLRELACTMSNFTSFAIVGAGGLGGKIVKHLAKVEGVKVTVISREGSETQVPEGVTIKRVDYSDSSSIEAALKGSEVVIATLGLHGMAHQPVVIDAAHRAGVKLFVPAEFGNPTEHVTSGFHIKKVEAAAQLKRLGLPSLRVFTGVFPEVCLIPQFGFDFKTGKAKWVGTGATPVGFTFRDDVASFLAHTLTTLPASSLLDRIFRIEGDRQSFNDVVDIWEELHPGSKIEITRDSLEEAEKVAETDKGIPGLLAYLFVSWEKGQSPYNSGPLDNHLFPEWKTTTVKDVLASL
ncbi:NAD(P)-binding protein [Meredithblackwellia eburnea MCA 4105]